MSLGVGAYAFAFFHLVTHAWFKACLFLGSGSVIHAMHHEQDIREMGGLRKKMPITYYTFLISTLAISGIPLTSGFLSKDGILAGSLAFGELTGHWFIPVIGFSVALMTAFYMFRLVLITFHGEPRNKEKYEHAHESPKVMTIPLIILAGLSVFFWYTPLPHDAQAGWFLQDWIQTPHTVVPESSSYEFMYDAGAPAGGIDGVTHSELYEETMHHVHYPALFLSLLMAGLGILLAYAMYYWKKISADALMNMAKPLYNFSLNKWYFDELYDATVIKGTLAISKLLSRFDLKVIDGIVDGSASVTKFISWISGKFDSVGVDGVVNGIPFLSGAVGLFLRKIQTGKVQTYIVLVVFALLLLILYISPI
jgi:NADH-quinone oxidoreductase subunit L